MSDAEIPKAHIKIVGTEDPAETKVWLNGTLIGRLKSVHVALDAEYPGPVVTLQMLPTHLETDIRGNAHVTQYREITKDGVP